ncbi:MAG TPA: hypothetical protein VFG47_02470 [Geminicoccaceae bacterium]|nr:hypothetical protein [Geminicoccaceae bacterium]
MTADLSDLLQRVRAATGHDPDLDAAIAGLEHRAAEVPAYTASVDACLALVHRALPGWGWHVGYDARGVIPYAAVSKGRARHEAGAPTVPLALLAAILRAKTGGPG